MTYFRYHTRTHTTHPRSNDDGDDQFCESGSMVLGTISQSFELAATPMTAADGPDS